VPLVPACAENEKGEAQFDLYFADVDPRLGAYAPKVRVTASETCRRIGALTDALYAARETLMESPLLRLARAAGRNWCTRSGIDATHDEQRRMTNRCGTSIGFEH
jgi:hypothetical protein